MACIQLLTGVQTLLDVAAHAEDHLHYSEVAEDNLAKFSTAAFQLKLTSSGMQQEQDHTILSNPMLTLFQELVL